MNRPISIIAGAIALAAASQASAALTQANTPGGSSLTLSVWDDVRAVSYTRNLGPNLNAFLPTGFNTLPNDGTVPGVSVSGDKTPAAGLNLSFAGDALFVSTFSPSLAGNVKWNIAAVDNQASTATGLSRVITTAVARPNTVNGGIGGIGTGFTNYTNSLIINSNISQPGINSAVYLDNTIAAYAGSGQWGDSLGGGLQGTSTASGFGSELAFFYLARTVVQGATATFATNLQYGNDVNFASWTLGSDGTATYNLSPVPLPGAVWLMGSGLFAVLAAARRRKAVTA